MFSAIVTLYFLGLTVLLFSNSLGLSLFRFRKSNLFLEVLVGYLTIIAIYAFYKSGFNTIGVFVALWIIGYVFFIRQQERGLLITKQDYLQRIVIIGVLWTMIFILKASYFWNPEYNCPNLLFVDNEFYMKVAEGYNLDGHENALGLRNMLFPFLDFAQPYRTNDFWLVSLGLDLTNIDTIYIWELFYSTVLIFICSLSVYEMLKRKFSFLASLVLAVLILFAFSGYWYRYLSDLVYPNHSGGYDPIGILAYPKLVIVFAVYFQFFLKYEMGKKVEAIYLLILIPLLVQSTIALFLIVFFIIVMELFQERKSLKKGITTYMPLIGIFMFLSIGCVLFYFFNQQKEQLFIGNSNLNVLNNGGVFDFIIQFIKKSTLLFISYYWLSFLLALLLLIGTPTLRKTFRIELFGVLLLCYLCSVMVYAWFNKIGDAFQFLTNVFGPFVIALIIYLLVQTPKKQILGTIKLTFLILVSCQGAKEMIGGNNFFHSTTRISYYDKSFIDRMKTVLPKLQYPLGIIYHDEDLQNYAKEDYPQWDTAFLKLFGRNYDVFNIEADSLTMNYIDPSLQKFNVSIQKNALNIWRNNLSNTSKKGTRKDFYAAYPFSFCISKKSKAELPDYIQSDVVSIVKDNKSQIYFYTLKRYGFKDISCKKIENRY